MRTAKSCPGAWVGFTPIYCTSSHCISGECGELARQVPPLKQGEEYNEIAILKYHLTPGPMYTSIITSSGATVQNSIAVRDAKAIGCGAYHALLVLMNPNSSIP